MYQVAQKLKDGKIQVLEVSIPMLDAGTILVKNYYSLISAGTEGSTVKAARKSLIFKAKERPQQAKQVLNHLKSQGPVETYRTVIKKLDSYSPLGYSCVGKVIDSAPDVTTINVGDFVACGGQNACHAEIVAVPENLCVKLPHDTDLRQAAYNSLGAIALQGIRQADLRLGEICVVIGLGLLGQLTCLLLRAAGVRAVGVDINQHMVDMAGKHCADLSLNRTDDGIENVIDQFTRGLGCDAVIITAASSSIDPINFAGSVSRKKGNIVVVGAVPTGFEREPHYYQKELQVRMSCSYGPGRYDSNYEDKGVDYPPAFVRWTENRNMQAFQELIYSKKIDVSCLTTHSFKLDDAPKAYDMIMANSEPFIGILIEYDKNKDIKKERVIIRPPSPIVSHPVPVSIGFIGAGSYAQGHLLPNIQKNKDAALKGIMTSSGTTSRSVAERFGFEFCTRSPDDILKNEAINTVFIATRHDTHASYTKQALQAGKNVFVEKPLCITIQQLDEIVELFAQGPRLKAQGSETEGNKIFNKLIDSNTVYNPNLSSEIHVNEQQSEFYREDHKQIPVLMVGYNRRFSPLAKIIKEKFADGPMAMIYRVNGGPIPPDSWIQDIDIGGGRIIGEICHFADFLTFINGSLPTSVYATAMESQHNLNDTVNISISYLNGSIGTISYFANGDKKMPKERVEIYSNGCVAVLDDFKRLIIYANGRRKVKKLLKQDKGQTNEIKLFINAIKIGTEMPISFEEAISASMVTFKAIDSIRTGRKIQV